MGLCACLWLGCGGGGALGCSGGLRAVPGSVSLSSSHQRCRSPVGPRSQVRWRPGSYPVGPVRPVFVGLLAPALWPSRTPQLGTPPHSPSAPPASAKHLDWKKRHHQSPEGFLLRASMAALLTPHPSLSAWPLLTAAPQGPGHWKQVLRTAQAHFTASCHSQATSCPGPRGWLRVQAHVVHEIPEGQAQPPPSPSLSPTPPFFPSSFSS